MDDCCIQEAKQAVDAALGAGRAVVLDLGGVEFAEPCAVQWLQSAVAAGAALERTSCFVHELLKGAALPAASGSSGGRGRPERS